ncbi:outer membrane protein assembly factor BamB family protein [Saccharibacillus alkalitolerans]|uniref:PQQ-binding-like beta-propeller repeat protein n=1 Tax=Saccharibacillus alkalitolerans TaxID=2705290 RepID=A0ABX0F3X5_9BACL|nr:PQQ-binding-like beta-propeller repeat protein [Saccharibacillus alkalitolerans]NGZ74599.1 PQQ-binding-like beta-propeller repeat protein [Saccharibacillus alkalitolerans]
MNRNILRSSRTNRRLAALTAALLLTAPFGAYAGTSPAAAASSAPVAESTAATRLSQPAWSKTAERIQAVAHGNTIYYQSGSMLTAADAKTGKTKWTYSARLAAPVQTLNNSLYAVTKKGVIVKLDARSGKALWTKKAPGKPSKSSDEYSPESFRLSGTTLYLADSKGLTQISAATGKQTRSFPKFTGFIRDIRGGMVFSLSVESGAYLREILQAYDGKGGKKIWEAQGDHNGILGYRGKYLYSRNIPLSLDQGHAAVIDKIDAKTGKIAESFEYVPVDFMGGMSAQFLVMSDGFFYFVQQGANSDKLQRIPVDAPSETKPETLIEAGKPIVNLAVQGNRIALLTNDGILSVFDKDTGNLRVSVKTKATGDSSLLLQDDKAFIQSAAGLSCIPIPLGGNN